MNSKVILVLFTITLLILFFIPNTNASTASPLREIDDMVNLLDQDNLSLQTWEVITKEKMGRDRVLEIKRKIEKIYPKSKFKVEKTEQVTKFSIDLHKNGDIHERFEVIVPSNTNHDAEIIYMLSGSIWDEQVEIYYSKKMERFLNNVFTGKSTIFSCVSVQTNGIMSSDYLFERVSEKLNVQTLDYIEEENLAVLSGYTDHWDYFLSISDKPMNVQLAARVGLGGKTIVTIGTPIITTEY
ncbi:YwmB family TATA-box binding protein [Aquibacillus saliphilus]|uniref:YwmB family TATA-box binding protein n=1 Tax=Aquibacillus saliphilus TaxID=1909422 RepID=UPI001CF040B1|nr:YwmB family TATA-box binding protein [Aquibacillus saliphilus]